MQQVRPTSPLRGGRNRVSDFGWAPHPTCSLRCARRPPRKGEVKHKNGKTNSVAALSKIARRHSEPLVGSPCHWYPACASFPPSRPRAWGSRAKFAREPRDPGLPCRRPLAEFRTSALSENKKPSGALPREGPCETDCRYRLGEIAPMSRACAVDRPKAVQQFAGVFVTALHCSSHVVFASGMPAKRAVFTCAHRRCQGANAVALIFR